VYLPPAVSESPLAQLIFGLQVEVGAAAYVTTAAGADEVELEVDEVELEVEEVKLEVYEVELEVEEVELEVDEVELEDDVELEAVEAGTVVTPAGSFAAKSRPLS
jgi:aconitase B